jgi:hypothetical protein
LIQRGSKKDLETLELIWSFINNIRVCWR